MQACGGANELSRATCVSHYRRVQGRDSVLLVGKRLKASTPADVASERVDNLGKSAKNHELGRLCSDAGGSLIETLLPGVVSARLDRHSDTAAAA